MTVQQLLANTDSKELSEWQAFFKLENKRFEEEKKKKPGQVTSKDPAMLSEALKAQLATKKAGV